MRNLIFVAFVEPVFEGQVFPRSDWPLHITLVRFDVEGPAGADAPAGHSDDIAGLVAELAGPCPPVAFALHVAGSTLFTPPANSGGHASSAHAPDAGHCVQGVSSTTRGRHGSHGPFDHVVATNRAARRQSDRHPCPAHTGQRSSRTHPNVPAGHADGPAHPHSGNPGWIRALFDGVHGRPVSEASLVPALTDGCLTAAIIHGNRGPFRLGARRDSTSGRGMAPGMVNYGLHYDAGRLTRVSSRQAGHDRRERSAGRGPGIG